jgi:hypothetical protein
MFEIRRVIVGYAYPKNGNVHKPTPRVRYDIYRDGKLIGFDHKLRDAKQFVADLKLTV